MATPDPDETEAINRIRRAETRRADRDFFQKFAGQTFTLEDEALADEVLVRSSRGRRRPDHPIRITE